MNPSVEKALKAKRESRYVEFKATFDVDSPRDWCELLKDFAAIANSGGGVVLMGISNRGDPNGADVSKIVALDPVVVSDKLQKFTDSHFADFQIHEVVKEGKPVAAVKIGPAFPPIVFTKPGTYLTDGNQQGRAFSQGTMYFRHGAKSEPATSEDLRLVLERELEAVRRSWLADVRKVVRAPAGSQIAVLPPTIRHADSPDARPIQIVSDPHAPSYRLVDFDRTHPHRAKEVMSEIRKRLPDDVMFNSFDLLCVRRVHGLDDRDEFVHKPKFGSPQYSPELVDWIVRQFGRDHRFFEKARLRYRQRDA